MKKIICLMMMAGLIFGINSCERSDLHETLMNEEESTFSIDQARTWYETNLNPELLLKSGNTGEKNPIIAQAQWENAIKSKNKKVEVVETHLLTQGTFGFATQNAMERFKGSKHKGYITSLSKLVILKYKKTGRIISFVMTIIGDAEYLEKKDFELWDNTYLKKDKDFSGYVFFHNLQGGFINGWKFSEGKTIKEVSQIEGSESPVMLKSTACMETQIIVVTYYYTDWYVNGSYDHTSYNGSSEETSFYLECDFNPYEEVIGGGGGTVNETYETAYCNCNVCLDCGGCIVYLKSATIVDECPMCSCPTPAELFFQEIDKVNLESPTLLQDLSCLMRDLRLNGGIMLTSETFEGIGDRYTDYSTIQKYFNYMGSVVEIMIVNDPETEAVRMGTNIDYINSNLGQVYKYEIFIKGEIDPSGALPSLLKIKFNPQDVGLWESVWKHIKGETNLWNCN